MNNTNTHQDNIALLVFPMILYLSAMNRNSFFYCLIIISLWLLLPAILTAQQKPSISFIVAMEQPASQVFQVQMDISNNKKKVLDLKLPVWSPGYYQRMDYAKNLQDFAVTASGKKLTWEKLSDNCWRIKAGGHSSIKISYGIKATRAFVATSLLNEEKGYIVPASVFLYLDSLLNLPVKLTIKVNSKWKQVATGLAAVAGKPFTYLADDYDILYDSPLLIGNLESLPEFSVDGIPHRFIGYQLGDFDRQQFREDLTKIAATSSAIIGDIPFNDYTFIGIGPGQGGIEHLNSTTISFSGSGLKDREGRIRTLHFIAHEYFHHYNVKRIRPFELGPFDYDKGNRSNLLWISEGLTVYYEYLVLKRAGISTEEELLRAIRSNVVAYEGKPGRLFQSLAQASYETWSDGPFGRTGDEVNKTISYYDKGPVVGLMLDFAIRHFSKNQRSLDDVMRSLYRRYYQQLKRGFTDAEFQSLCEEMAGQPLTELFEYTHTVRELDYKKYFGYGGLDIDITPKEQPGPWLGITTRSRNDSVFVSNVEWDSPAWKAGLRSRQLLLEIDGKKATASSVEEIKKNKNPGDTVLIKFVQEAEQKTAAVKMTVKTSASFEIKRLPDAESLQSAILNSWLK